MSETMTILNSNNIILTQNPISFNQETPGDESTEPLAPVDIFPFRRIEFHLARKPFTGFSHGGGDGSFRLETLNPAAASSCVTNVDEQRVVSGRKRDAVEMENGLDPELGFGISFSFRRIGAGLENLGNTCFLNSVLQCLTYTEPLAAYLQSGKHQVTCRKSGFCALCAIQKHVSRALQLSGRSLAPKDLVSNLRCISRTFRNSRQEDAHEYMVNLLESMHKCCLPNGVPSESQSAYDRSLVHKIFGGRLRSQVKCMQCNYCSNKFDPFLDLSLEILRADTIYKAFANFTAKEQLDGGAKQYQCQQCKQKVKALKQLTIHKPPNVLTVHLKRFGSHVSGQKIDKKIQFGPTLDLKPFVTGPYDGDLKYTLYGVLVHAGWSTHSGHYYCFVRTSSGMWYSLDDNRVYQVSEKKVFEQKAYMLFYFKDRKNIPTKKATDVHHKDKIVMNGPLNGPGAAREAQTKTGLSNGSSLVAPKEISTNTVLSNVSINGHSSSVPVSTQNGSSAPKEAEIKTGLSDGSLNAETALVTGNGRNGFTAIAPKRTQTDFGLCNGSLNGQKSSAAAETISNGFSNVATEATQKKQASVPKSISEPSKTEDHMKEIGGGELSGGNNRGNEKAVGGNTNTMELPDLSKTESSIEKKALVEKTVKTDPSDLPKTESFSEKKALGGKTDKKVKNALKCKIVTMKFSSNVLMGTSLLNKRKKKKHKRNKRVKNLGQENSVSDGPSSSAKTEPQESVKPVKSPVENGLKERVDKDGAVPATSDLNGDSTGSQSHCKESKRLENCSKSSAQKNLVHMLTVGDDGNLPRWDEDASAPFQKYRENKRDLTIGYIGDEWDEEYDRGKRKKVRISKTEFDGKNPFQDIANERLKSHMGKQNLSKRPFTTKNKNNGNFKKSRSGNEPFRIRN
ncbi:putative ubiquitinyl hydrolase 1 [Helianthus debilis subsp. tardiflorus]